MMGHGRGPLNYYLVMLLPAAGRMTLTEGPTRKIRLGCGTLYVTLCNSPADGHLVRVLARIGKAGQCQSCLLGAVVCLINDMLEHGSDRHHVGALLSGFSCPYPVAGGPDRPRSCVDALAQELVKK